jgi:hypothetical protein
MKTTSRILLGFICVAVIFVTLANPLMKALADEGDEAWGEFLNPDGSINWANLTYLGEASEPADWMSIEIPGGIQMPLGEARYSRYVTPSGNLLVLPSPATMFMTFLHPEASGFATNTPEMLSSGHQILAALAADYIDVEDLQALGYVDPAEFFQAVIDGRENIWSVVSPNFLIEIARMSLDAGFLVTGLWLYLSGVNCDAIPGGCPPGFGLTPTPGGPGGTPTPPPPIACPAPSIAFEDVNASGEKVAPPKPVVVGQDPEKRGADVELRVTIPPIIFTWYEARTTHICEYASGGNGGGCTGPGSRYDRVTDADGSDIGWGASMENNSNWDASSETECIQHVEVFPDYLDYASLSINLSPESRNWILTDLAQAYPGAHLKRPDWQFAFQGPGGVGGGSVVYWSQLIPEIQLADPGVYRMQVSGRTTGTLVSAPRPFNLQLSEFMVDLLRVTLIEAP